MQKAFQREKTSDCRKPGPRTPGAAEISKERQRGPGQGGGDGEGEACDQEKLGGGEGDLEGDGFESEAEKREDLKMRAKGPFSAISRHVEAMHGLNRAE